MFSTKINLRDYFAGQAIGTVYKSLKNDLSVDNEAFMCNSLHPHDWEQGNFSFDAEMLACECYAIADAMMKVRLA
jgi:hypothetical protein